MSTLTENETTNETAVALPRWQQLTGLTAEREAAMTDDEREAAVRLLIKEVETQAKVEFERAEKAPHGERTVFWDPLEKICRVLGISRTKLSRYSREQTGLRAHEITDRIKAQRYLRRWIETWVLGIVPRLFAKLEEEIDSELMEFEPYRMQIFAQIRKAVKARRSGLYRARWAVSLSFPNPSRLNKACLMALGRSMDEAEAELVYQLVQKFFEKMKATGREETKESLAPSREDAKMGEEEVAKPRGGRMLARDEDDDEIEDLSDETKKRIMNEVYQRMTAARGAAVKSAG